MLAFSTSSGARYVLDGRKMVRLEGPEITSTVVEVSEVE